MKFKRQGMGWEIIATGSEEIELLDQFIEILRKIIPDRSAQLHSCVGNFVDDFWKIIKINNEIALPIWPRQDNDIMEIITIARGLIEKTCAGKVYDDSEMVTFQNIGIGWHIEPKTIEQGKALDQFVEGLERLTYSKPISYSLLTNESSQHRHGQQPEEQELEQKGGRSHQPAVSAHPGSV
jgi:hypothetical protein